MRTEIVELKNVNLKFGEVHVLNDISFKLYTGEVCSIMGENGSGKSSLMKILSGSYTKTSGQVFLDGKEVNPKSVFDAQMIGVHMIYHEIQLVENANVFDNIFLGHELVYNMTQFVNQKMQIERASQVLDYLESGVNPKQKVHELNLLQKRMVEIAKAVVLGAKLIILDETTAAFSSKDKDKLFSVIRKLKNRGVTVVFISHQMGHVLELSDRLLVMRGGRLVGEKHITGEDVDIDEVLINIAGEEYVNRYPKTGNHLGNTVLETEELCSKSGYVQNVNFYARKGEIVGIAGLQGMGKTTLTQLLAGVQEPASGSILLDGIHVEGKTTPEFVTMGIAYLSENNRDNLLMDMDVKYNISLPRFSRLKEYFVNHNENRRVAEYFIERLHLRNITHSSKAETLSRGNQQKVALSKWIESRARALVLNQPSANLDSASKVELYNLLNKLARKGRTIIMASPDLSELMGMCDRIYVMFEGKIVKEIKENEKSSLLILEYASGKIR